MNSLQIYFLNLTKSFSSKIKNQLVNSRFLQRIQTYKVQSIGFQLFCQFINQLQNMQKIKKDRSSIITIPPLHTYLIKQYDTICQTFQIQLESGSAEINGVDLMKYYPHTYTLPCFVPVFTWQGCKIKVNWKQEDGIKSSDQDWCDITEFHSHQDPMIKYLELHYQLTCLRKLALQQVKQGPRLAIIGSQSSGTTLVSKLMLNYAGKLNMKPIYVDLDIQNSIFIDGTISSMVFEYKICEDFFDRPEKISFFYGNRKIKRKSFLKQITLIADSINRKIQKQLKSFKQKGSNQEYPMFSSGVIIHCPRIMQKQDKKSQKQLIYQILKIFKISHVLSIQDMQIAHHLSKKQQGIQKYNLSKLQGTSNFNDLPKPLRTKINRYFEPQLVKNLTLQISDIHLYELMQQQGKQAYCRQIQIRQQPIAKSTISILYCQNNLGQSMQIKAQKALLSPITCLAFIFRIAKDEIILQVLNQNFWQQSKNKLWMSMISQHN